MEKKFKPFEKVIYKEKLFSCRWHCAFFSDYNESNGCVNFADGKHYHFTKIDILPYEGNEELVGTTDNPDEEVRLEDGERVLGGNNPSTIFKRDVDSDDLWWYWKVDEVLDSCIRVVWVGALPRQIQYFIKAKDVNYDDMEETKKHILCVKNGRIVKYKN